MAWVDVAAKIKFYGVDGTPTLVNGIPAAGYGGAFSALGTDKSDILTALEALYTNSLTARELLDRGVAGSDIWLLNRTGAGSGAVENSRTAGIDLTQATTFQWMGRDGHFQLERLGGNVIHELIHAIDGTHDLADPFSGAALGSQPRPYNAFNFDHLGLTVEKQNEIFQEMGWGDGYWQVGYDATLDVNRPLLRTDISYSLGNTIDIAYFDSARNQTPDVLDLSNRLDNSNDLIIGFGGDDVIRGGAGRDYLYGSIGNDTFFGGSGSNFIDGGDRVTFLADDGTDTVDYTTGDFNQAPDHGVTVDINPQISTSIDGALTIIVSDNGFGGTDTLLSIEKLILSPKNDVVHISGGAQQLLMFVSEIDASGHDGTTGNIVDFSGFSSAVHISADPNSGEMSLRLGDTHTVLKNFQTVIGTDYDDVIHGGPSYSNLLGGGDDDVLFAGSGGATLDGGTSVGSLDDDEGNEYVGGDGVDTFVIGNGADAMNGSGSSFIISNASAADRLVLRLDDALGFADPANWMKGIVLNGGLGASDDPDVVDATYSSILVRPQTIDMGGPGSDGAILTETSLDVIRPELGFFEVTYEWHKPDSQLFISVQSAYGRFEIRVDGFQEGQLGLNFVSAEDPIVQEFVGPEQSRQDILDSWDEFDSVLQGFIGATQIVDLPSPGDPNPGSAAPITPIAGLSPFPGYDHGLLL
jgi:hypothetical protein